MSPSPKPCRLWRGIRAIALRGAKKSDQDGGSRRPDPVRAGIPLDLHDALPAAHRHSDLHLRPDGSGLERPGGLHGADLPRKHDLLRRGGLHHRLPAEELPGVPLGRDAGRHRPIARPRPDGIGYPSFRLGGHYFAIATIAVAEILYTVVLNTNAAGSGRGHLPAHPPGVAGSTWSSTAPTRLPYYYIILAFLSIALYDGVLDRAVQAGLLLQSHQGGSGRRQGSGSESSSATRWSRSS